MLKRFKRQRGATATEHGLLIGGIAVIALAALAALGLNLDKLFTKAGDCIQGEICEIAISPVAGEALPTVLPNPIPPVRDAQLRQIVTSDTVRIEGFSSPITLQLQHAELLIDGTVQRLPLKIDAPTTVQLRTQAPATALTTRPVTFIAGAATVPWSVTTADTTPELALPPLLDRAPGELAVGGPYSAGSFAVPLALALTAVDEAALSIDSGASWVAGPVTLSPGQPFLLRQRVPTATDGSCSTDTEVSLGETVVPWHVCAVDSTPDFAILPVIDADAGASVESEPFTVEGMTVAAAAQLSVISGGGAGPQLQRSAGSGWEAVELPGQIAPNDRLKLSWNAGSVADGSARMARLSIGGVARDWTVTVKDATPDVFVFTDKPDAELGETATAETLLRDFRYDATATVSGSAGSPQIALSQSGPWTGSGGSLTVPAPDEGGAVSLWARVTAADAESTEHRATVTVAGTQSADFAVTTGRITPNAFAFDPVPNATGDALVTSNAVTLAGMTVAAPFTLDVNGAGEDPVLLVGGQALDEGQRIPANASIALQMRAASGSAGGSRVASLTVGNAAPVSWTVATEDTAPEGVVFAAVENAGIGARVYSAEQTLDGVSRSIGASVTGPGEPEVERRGESGVWVPVSSLSAGDLFRIAVTAADADATPRIVTVTLGSVAAQDFSVTTGNRIPGGLADLPDTLDVPAGDWRYSAPIQLTGMTLPPAGYSLQPEEGWLRLALLQPGQDTPTVFPEARPENLPANARLVLAMQSPPGLAGEARVAQLTVHGQNASWRMTNADSVPDEEGFAFAERRGIAADTAVDSNIVQLAGMRTAGTLVLDGSGGFTPQIAINGVWQEAVPATVPVNASLQLRLVTGAVENGTPRSVTVSVAGLTRGWDVYTRDTRPDAFDIADTNDALLSTLRESPAVQIAGIDAPATVQVSGAAAPQFRVSSTPGLGSWTSGPASIEAGQYLQLRMTSAAAQATGVSATVSVGGISDVWTLRTGTRTPDAFAFAPSPDQVGGSTVTAAAVTLAGMTIEAPYTVASSDGTAVGLSVNGGSFSTAASGTLPANASVRLQMAAAPGSNGAVRSATLTVAGVQGGWTVTTRDTTPRAFGWASMAGQTENAVIASDSTVTVEEIATGAPISISGPGNPEYSINERSWTSAAGTVQPGETVAVRLTAAPSALTDRTATVTIGGVAGTFTVRTQGSDNQPDDFLIAASPGVAPNAEIPSALITPLNFDAPVMLSLAAPLQGNVQISINNRAFGTGGRLYPGQSFRLKATSGSYDAVVRNAVIAGTVRAEWVVTSRSYDNVPTGFTFATVSGQLANTAVPAAAMTLGGFTDPTTVTVAGQGNPQISINGGAWTTSATANPNDSLSLRLTTGLADGTALNAQAIFAGGASQAGFTVTTVDAMPDNPFPGGTSLFNMYYDCCPLTPAVTLTGASVPVRYNGVTISPNNVGVGPVANWGGTFRSPGEMIAPGTSFTIGFSTVSAAAGASGTANFDFGGTIIAVQWSMGPATERPRLRFTVPDLADRPLATLVESDWVQIVDNRVLSTFSISGSAEIQIEGTSTWSTAGQVPPSGRFRARMTTAGTPNTAVSSTISVGGYSDVWTVTTEPADRLVALPLNLPNPPYVTGTTAGGHGGWSAWVQPTGYNVCLPITSTGQGNFMVSSNGDWDHGWTNSTTICPGQSFVFAFYPPTIPGDRADQTFFIDGVNVGTVSYILDPALAGTPQLAPFPAKTGEAGDSWVESAAVVVQSSSTYQMRASVSGEGSPQLSVAGGAWANTGVVTPGQSIRLRLTSGPPSGVTRNAQLTVGGATSSWSVTTRSTMPDPASLVFLDALELEPGAPLVPSNTVTVTGFASTAAVTVTGSGNPKAVVNAGAGSNLISPGDTLVLYADAPSGYGQEETVTVNVGGRTANWHLSTRAADTTPAPFTIAAKSGQALNSLTTSDPFVPKAFLDAADITVTATTPNPADSGNPVLLINGTPATPGQKIEPGQSFSVRLTSAPTPNTARSATVTVGGVSATFTVTTGNGGS